MLGEKSAADLGLEAFSHKQWKRARFYLEEGALAGDRAAAYHMGILLWRGWGGAADPESALYWFRRAAEDQLPAALDALGVALRAGVKGQPDIDLARQCFAKAAEKNYTPAIAHLAEMSQGAAARALLTQAAEAGHVASMLRLADESEDLEPIEALAWLYEAVALSGNEDYLRRAKALAREMVLADIDAAVKRAKKHLAWLENVRKLGRA